MKEISAGKLEHGPYYPDAMWPGHKASAEVSAEVKNDWSCIFTSFDVFISRKLIMHGHNFNFFSFHK
jgi:hypothetical protein